MDSNTHPRLKLLNYVLGSAQHMCEDGQSVSSYIMFASYIDHNDHANAYQYYNDNYEVLHSKYIDNSNITVFNWVDVPHYL